MKRSIILGVAMLLSACTNPYTGQIDPVATTLAVGAGAVAVGALGYAAGQNSAPRYYYHAAPRYHHAPRYHYHHGYRRW